MDTIKNEFESFGFERVGSIRQEMGLSLGVVRTISANPFHRPIVRGHLLGIFFLISARRGGLFVVGIGNTTGFTAIVCFDLWYRVAQG